MQILQSPGNTSQTSLWCSPRAQTLSPGASGWGEEPLLSSSLTARKQKGPGQFSKSIIHIHLCPQQQGIQPSTVRVLPSTIANPHWTMCPSSQSLQGLGYFLSKGHQSLSRKTIRKLGLSPCDISQQLYTALTVGWVILGTEGRNKGCEMSMKQQLQSLPSRSSKSKCILGKCLSGNAITRKMIKSLKASCIKI
jgi:hypothetical protein